MDMEKVKVAVLCSGGGTNLQAILSAEQAGMIPDGKVVLVISDRKGAYCLERAKMYGIETCVFDRKEIPDRARREEMIVEKLREHGVGLVVLAGFMTILGETFLNAFCGRAINIHPALLPSFGGAGYYGLHVHEAVLARGVKVTGATVHLVTADCDGGPILAQRAVEVREGDTPETLQKRVMREAEWVILPETVQTVCNKLKGEVK